MAPRRSSTRSQASSSFNAAVVDEPSDSEEEMPTRAPRKKPRTESRSTSKKAKGKSKASVIGVNMLDFPADVLYEILYYLKPKDLLHLSRTSKDIREAVTSKSIRFIWRKVIEMAGMPPCPSDLTEIGYTQFVLDAFCDYCSNSRVKLPDLQYIYLTRRKVCKPCVKAKFIDISDDNMREVMPCAVVRSSRSYRALATYRVDRNEYGAALADFATQKDERATATWLAEKKTAASAKEQLRNPLQKWFSSQQTVEDDQKKSTRQGRYDAVVAKLKNEGWSQEIAWMESTSPEQQTLLHRLKPVALAQPLTEQAWVKMKADVLTTMQGIREYRLKQGREDQMGTRLPLFKEAIMDYMAIGPYDPFAPSFADVASHPDVLELLRSPTGEVDKDDFNDLLNRRYDDIVRDCRKDVKDALVELIKVDIPSANHDTLLAPYLIFDCVNCLKALQYPYIMSHSCARKYWSSASPGADDHIYNKHLGCKPWNKNTLSYNRELSGKVRQSLLLQPDIRPSQNLMALELFQCTVCSQEKGRRAFMTWNEAISGQDACLAKGHLLSRASLTSEEEKLRDLYVDLKLVSYIPSINLVCTSCMTYASLGSGFARPEGDFSHHQFSKHHELGTIWREGVHFYRPACIITNICFKEDFVLGEVPDVRDVIHRAARFNSTYGFTRSNPVFDFRTDSTFARDNYSFVE